MKQKAPSEILLINGPNLARLGTRSPEIYGSTSLNEVELRTKKIAEAAGFSLKTFQSNHEGEIIDFLENNHEILGAVINPGALMMAGWSLRDALEDFPAPWVEIHISNVWSRESFRHNSILSDIADGVIVGFGVYGYILATKAIIEVYRRRK